VEPGDLDQPPGCWPYFYGGRLWADILAAIAAIAAVGVVARTMAFLTLKGRVARG